MRPLIMAMRHRDVAVGIGFQLTWLACAFGASSGLTWPALTAAGIQILLSVIVARDRRGRFVTCAAMGAAGLVVETLFFVSGLITYSAHWPVGPWAPLWLVGLWGAFGTTAGVLANLLGRHKPLRYALAGAVAGPVTYAAGDAVGALSLAQPVWQGYLAIALAWAIALPMMMRIAERVESRTGQ